ncbi:acyl-CoA thioester hydrolase [Loktanella fryxellensis]|uniref:Acyl-CoA thioester hydrolase n=1 Tax=Loktanella fryxellensis TaxID=245187 RepID=A0A1H8BEE9_9RHOB|nr:thioesterase family protein [Loktanella fryxellensis]SEM81126.1 acyl-CoA thioester hydrolase [Loktanella fryxellensis]
MTVPYLTPLHADDLRRAGIPEPWSFGMADKVRFGEIDALQHVNNAVYLKWFENLRMLYFADAAVWQIDGKRPRIVLRQIGLDYRSEIKLSDRYIMTGRTSKLGTSSFTMEYAVWVEGRLMTTSHAVIVVLGENNAKRAIPDHIRQMFIDRDGAVAV